MNIKLAIMIFCIGFQIFADDLENDHQESTHSKKISINIGESEDISYEENAHIQISKRGVVDAQILSKKIRLVGLRAGLVVITIRNEGNEFKYFVTVHKIMENLSLGTESLKQLSQRAQLIYLDKTEEIEGITDQTVLFYKIKDLCEQKKTCVFHAKLSEHARTALIQDLEKILGKSYELSVQDNGAAMALTACSDKLNEKEQTKIVQHLVGSETFKKHILVACKKDWHNGSYTLFSKIIVMESSTAKNIGLQTHLEFNRDLNLTNLDAELNAALKNHTAELIGEPVIWLLSGVEAQAKSGAEMLILKEQRSTRNGTREVYEWKEMGLDLKVKVFPLNEKKVRLQYTFLISNPSKTSGHIHKNSMESEIELTLDRSAIAGGIQFKRSGKETGTIAFIESIPIIGPLFKRVVEDGMESNLYLYFYLVKSEDQVREDKSSV